MSRSTLGLVCLQIALVGAGVEGLARLAYRPPWYDRLIATQTESQARQYRKNADGLRDRDYGPKAPGERRILVLGDSFTYGIGVDEDAPFPRLLERELNEAGGATSHRVEVLNGGIPGSLTTQWLSLLLRVQARFDPDVVLVVFFLRDGTRITLKEDFFDPIRAGIVERNRASGAYRHSYAYRMVRDRLDQKDVARAYIELFDRSYFGDPKETQEWTTAEQNIAEIRDRARRRGAAVGLVVFPVLVELDRPYPFERICEHVTRFGSANGLPTFDLLPAFRGRDATRLWVSPLDQHPNAEAHEIAARAMLPFVRGLLEQSGRGDAR